MRNLYFFKNFKFGLYGKILKIWKDFSSSQKLFPLKISSLPLVLKVYFYEIDTSEESISFKNNYLTLDTKRETFLFNYKLKSELNLIKNLSVILRNVM